MLLTCFATTTRGLEQLLADELTGLGASEISLVNAGVSFKAEFDDLPTMNLHSHLASRIMIEVGHSGYRDSEDIYRLASKINWGAWFDVGHSIRVSTNAIASALPSLDFVTLRVKDAICDYFNAKFTSRPDVNKTDPDMRIYNFLTKDSVTIYLDTSGETLFKRGWRKSKVEAPIRENLAFGLIKLSGWDYTKPFYDPMCGGGTLVIEAIHYGLNIAPGLKRNFAFEKFNKLNKSAWQQTKLAAQNAIQKERKLQIFASDIDVTALNIMKQNLRDLNFEDMVTVSQGDFIDQLAPASNGILIANMPYGIRLDEQDNLARVYPLIGSVLKKNFAGWACYLFTADMRLPKLIRLKPARKIPLFNGALECRLYQFDMVHGSNRSN